MTTKPLDPTPHPASRIIEDLIRQGFWGNLNLVFQRGEIVRAVKEESILFKAEYRTNDKPNSK